MRPADRVEPEPVLVHPDGADSATEQQLKRRRLLQAVAAAALVIVGLVGIASMSSDEEDPSDERGPSSTLSMRSDEGGGGADQEVEAEPTLVSTQLVLRVPSRCDVNCQSRPDFFPPTPASCEVIGYYSDGSQRSMGWQQC